MLPRPFAVAAFIGYGALVAMASLRPADGVSLEHSDKLLHLVTYAVFAALGAIITLKPRPFLILCLLIVVYSGLMEWGQSFVPGRVMSWGDMIANALGILLGAWCARRSFSRASPSP